MVVIRKGLALLRKLLVFMIAAPLFVVGLILIPLPGPGLLTCLVALMIFSLEFDFAKPHVKRIKRELASIWEMRRKFD
ncbi:hypothetical protein KDA23_05955 [Candidatus Saccharibacteria bacterium]|nr:hypothetical protein [Candidatus Saccharibacteria bacterium]